MSPSWTTYSAPSRRILPASLAPCSPPWAAKSLGARLGADEALFEIGVDDAGRLRRLGAARDGPGMRLLGPDREKRDEIEQAIAGANDARQARLFEAERLEGGVLF